MGNIHSCIDMQNKISLLSPSPVGSSTINGDKDFWRLAADSRQRHNKDAETLINIISADNINAADVLAMRTLLHFPSDAEIRHHMTCIRPMTASEAQNVFDEAQVAKMTVFIEGALYGLQECQKITFKPEHKAAGNSDCVFDISKIDPAILETTASAGPNLDKAASIRSYIAAPEVVEGGSARAESDIASSGIFKTEVASSISRTSDMVVEPFLPLLSLSADDAEVIAWLRETHKLSAEFDLDFMNSFIKKSEKVGGTGSVSTVQGF